MFTPAKSVKLKERTAGEANTRDGVHSGDQGDSDRGACDGTGRPLHQQHNLRRPRSRRIRRTRSPLQGWSRGRVHGPRGKIKRKIFGRLTSRDNI